MVIWPSSEQPGQDKQCTPQIDTVSKSEKLSHFSGANDICGAMWLFLKSTHLVHPLYTPSSWYTPGKFWYTLGCTIHPVDKHWFTASPAANAYCFTAVKGQAGNSLKDLHSVRRNDSDKLVARHFNSPAHSNFTRKQQERRIIFSLGMVAAI